MPKTKISDEITVMGQVSREEIKEAAKEGFRSVLNLRAPDEEGVLSNEEQAAESEGLRYVNIPVRKQEISDELTSRVLSEMNNLPKPLIIHCATGMRAGAMAFMHMAIRMGLTAEEAMQKAQSVGFDCSSEPELKQFFEHYVNTHSQTFARADAQPADTQPADAQPVSTKKEPQ